MNKKFTLEELSNIRPGDLVLYDYFWAGNEEWHKVLKVAVRYGLDKDSLLNSDDDYLIVEDGDTVDEVDYKDILDIKKQDTKYYIAEKETGICLFEPYSFNILYFDTIEDAKQHLIELGENVDDYDIKEN